MEKCGTSFSLVSDVPYIVYVYSDGANAKLRIEDIVRYTINEFAKISSRNVPRDQISAISVEK